MSITFPVALIVLGLILLVASGLSGWLRGNVLSITVLAVAAGAGLELAGVLEVEPESPGVIEVVELALVLTLFSDGLTVEGELLRERWRDPLRSLVVAMPLTLVLIGLAAKGLIPELSWWEALLLGAVLAPTDPVVTSTVVSSARVPVKVRHALNLESGLNDGLALPFVLVLLVLATSSDWAGAETLQTAGESAAGAVIGGVLAFAACWLLPRLPGGGIAERYEGVYALAVPLLAFGVSEATIGNGLVATFVAGIVFALKLPEMPRAFPRFNENLSSILSVVSFVLFGALVVHTDGGGDPLAVAALIVALLFVIRPLAIVLSFARSGLSRPEIAFIAWFGPKGVASMLFSLFVLESAAPDRTIVFEVASLVILASILLHGLTDTLGARWVERKMAAT